MKQEIELKEGMTCVVKGGKLVVETPEWKSKVGDVVTNQLDGAIFIQKSSYKTGTSFYAALYNGKFYTDGNIGYNSPRLATREERCTFFARLVAEGYKWNAKKLKLTKVEKKWSPVDGEFVYQKDEECEWISIFKQKTDRDTNKLDVYCSFIVSGKHSIPNTLKMSTTCRIVENGDVFMVATQSERQQLLDALAKAGKRWNAELKRVEDVKPEYKEGDFITRADGAISIYKNKVNGKYFDHAYWGGRSIIINENSFANESIIMRLSTEEEKRKMISELYKVGKVWNATKKRIENIGDAPVEMTMEQVCEKLGMNVKIVKK